jgi:hypothetical protein
VIELVRIRYIDLRSIIGNLQLNFSQT